SHTLTYYTSRRIPRPPCPPLYPCTTLFGSQERRKPVRENRERDRDGERRGGDPEEQRRRRDAALLRHHAADVALRDRHRDARHRSEEHTSELQSLAYLVWRLLLEIKRPPEI